MSAARDPEPAGRNTVKFRPLPDGGQEPQESQVPDLFTTGPPIKDSLETATSESQKNVEETCKAFLAGRATGPVNQHGIPPLRRERHIKFLEKHLGDLPAGYQSVDSSRPWIFYWCLHGLSLLGTDISKYRDGLVETARSIQNESGGFGGGFGQLSHLATTYATVLSLAIVAGESAYRVIDRRAMWKWLCTLKEPDGGFRLTRGGEIDVRQVMLLLNHPPLL
ncbi:CaaX farnesyltransferase beta subunit Ram1 [Astrocystis sublimbata]|nr:CaaX farnesyltransferase beta subunit Ram1 [Astrocystis sublimbata]